MLLFDTDFERIRWQIRQGGERQSGELPIEPDVRTWLDVQKLFRQVDSVGYILPNGGEVFTQPATLLDPLALNQLAVVVPLLPGPNRAIYQLAQAGLQRHPHLLHTIYCQTAFFASLPPEARTYPLPYELSEGGYRRYGGDGLAHAWAWEQAARRLPGIHKLVSVHAGSGVSTAAIQDGLAVETSQGYSPVEGPPGTTTGDVDPGIVLLFAENGMSATEIEQALTRQAGLSALAGQRCTPADRAREAAPEALARQVLVNGLVKAVGACASALGGVDALVFSGEAVEAMLGLFQEVCARLAFAGLKPALQTVEGGWELSQAESPVRAFALRFDWFEAVGRG